MCVSGKSSNGKRLIAATKWDEFYQEMTKDLKPYDHYDDGYRDAMDNVDDWMDGNQVEAEPKWISVEDRLPDKQSDVLMLFKHNMAVGFWHDGDEDVTFWCAYTDDVFYTDCDEEPTHWMPLPQAPKGE